MGGNKRYYSLDLLKFILSIFIVFHHFQQLTSIRFGFFNFFDGLINFAYCVEMFFIISGFLSAGRIEKIQESSFKDYIMSKIIRLYPMAILSTFAMIVLELIHYLLLGEWADGLRPDLYKVLNSFLLTFCGGSVKCGRGVNSPLWYLSVLMICYMFMWLILRICRKYDFSILYCAIGMCSIGVGIFDYGIDLPFLNEYTARGYASFFLGVILYLIYQKFNKKKLTVISVSLLALCTVLMVFDYSSFYQYEWGSYVFVISPCVLFVTMALDRFCHFELIRKLGGSSFEIYLWHMAFIMIYEILSGLSLMPVLSDLAMMILLALIIVVFSYLMHVFFEKKITGHMMKIGRSLLN